MNPIKRLALLAVLSLSSLGATAAERAPADALLDPPTLPHLVLPWYDGVIANIGTNLNCITGTPEIRVQGYAGFTLLPPNKTPAVGEVFYAHLVLSHPGNPCAGSAVGVGIILPPGVSTAVSAGNPVFCFGRGASGTLYDLGNDAGYGCPQTFSAGLDNSLALIPPRGGLVINGQKSYAWGMAQGFWLEFMLPLTASAPQAGNNNIQWRVNPDVGVVGYPKVPVFVNNDVLFRSSIEDNQLTITI
ncbi:MAG TPA: hypothetical protein PLN91_04675 [Rhodanobacteraceae bacterium]|nr:hypothetical protein [Rhodanobacteraceae bacterium]